MSEPAQPAAPAQSADPPRPNVFERVVEHVLPHQQPPAPAVAVELKPVLHGHAALVFDLARDVFSDPQLSAALAPKVLELVVGAAKIASVAL